MLKNNNLVFLALDHRHLHVVSGRADVLELLVGENVQSHHVHLGMAVLASLRGAHLNNLKQAPVQFNTKNLYKE
jgi:hypothetical protein